MEASLGRSLPLPTSQDAAIDHSAYRPDIDGLRAFAALAVVGVHTGVLAGGFIGVDIFFVISGYLITGLILRAVRRGTFSIFEFYGRRTKRIFPALLVILCTSAILGWLTSLAYEYQQLGRSIAEGAFFTRNLSMYFGLNAGNHDAAARGGGLEHLWSLGVEEQFYLFWPLFLLMTSRLGRWQLLLITFLTAISFLLNLEFAARGPMAAYFLPWTRFWQLSVGSALAHLEQTPDSEKPWGIPSPLHWPARYGANTLGTVGAALLVVSCFAFDTPAPFPGWGALVPTLGSCLFIAAGRRSWINRRLFGAAPMVFVGLVSYPLYLWHAPMLALRDALWTRPSALVTAGAMVTAFVLSVVTYKFIEVPIRSSRRTSLIAGILCLAIAVCGGIGYLIYAGIVPTRAESPQVRKFVSAATEDWLPGSRGTTWTLDPGPLVIGHTARYALFIGDSNIQQFYPRIAKLLAEHPHNSRGAVFAARDWCAPIDSSVPDGGAMSPACRTFAREAYERAKDARADTVVIGACWRCYFVTFDDLFARTGHVRAGTDQALDRLGQRIRSLVLDGKRVYLVLGIPVGADLDPRSLIRRTISPAGFRVMITSGPSKPEMLQVTESINRRLIGIAQATGAVVIDPMQWLCGDMTCPAISPAGDPMYHDWFDLSPSYVRDHVHFLDATVLDSRSELGDDTAIRR